MSRPRAGIDLDGVVYEWEARARVLLETHWGVALPESVHYFGIREGLIIHLGIETGRRADAWLFAEGWRHGLWDQGEEVPGAVDALQRLALCHDLVVITKRPRTAIPYTWDWLLARRIHPIEMIVIPPDADRGKSTVPCDWYVDDSPAIAAELTAAGKRVYLLDRLWNRDCQAGKRVMNWEDLLKHVFRPTEVGK